jgi:hypothetical protein
MTAPKRKRTDNPLRHLAWICGCSLCKGLRRDAETARLILKHRPVLMPRRDGVTWHTWISGSVGGDGYGPLATAVRRAAKAGRKP